jgi:hypothetical protein
MTDWARWLGALWLALACICSTAQPLVEIPRGTLQAEGGTAHEVGLPHKVYRPQRVFAPYRFEASFSVDSRLSEVRAMLQLDSWPDGGRILINGVEVANLATSSEQLVVRYLRPFAFLLPVGLLLPGENRLVMEWGSRETLVLVTRLRVGPRSAIEAQFERQLFWEYTAVQASLVFAAVVALVTLGVWWQQRRRGAPPEYLLIGIGALGWIVFNSALLWSPVPADWFHWRRVIGITGIGLFVLGMWVCLARLAGAPMRRFEAFAALWVAAGPVLLTVGHAITGATHLPTFEAVWSVGAAGLGLVPLVVLLRAVLRAPTPRLALLLGFALVALALAVREAAIYLLRDPIGTLHLGLQVLAPLWLATACGILVQDFVRSLRAAQAQREALDLQLEVTDDGRGFSLDGHAPGKGLVGMRKRARGLGGDLSIEPTARGTRVRLELPCAAPVPQVRRSSG